MQKVDFFRLPRATQDRFIESSRGTAVPVPLGVRPHRSWSVLLWLGGCLLALALWIGFVLFGFGELDNSLALASPAMIAVHALFAVVVVFCGLRAQALQWETQRLPFRRATYLFPFGVVEAHGPLLVAHSTDQLASVQAQGSDVAIRFTTGASFTFRARNPDQAQAIADEVQKDQSLWAAAQASGDALEQSHFSPLVDSGVPNPLAPTSPHMRQTFLGPMAMALVLLVAGVGLGWSVWWIRNDMSEEKLYVKATQENTAAAYSAYLKRGGERKQVEEILLPRAELKEAEAKGTVEAIQAYIDAHPDSKIAHEVDQAHRKALLDALEQVKKRNTLAAFSRFEKRFPASKKLIPVELAAARHEVYRSVYEDFAKAVNPDAEDLVTFGKRLVDYAEKHGAEVQVRFRRRLTQDAERIDQIVKKSPYYVGATLLPSQYFLGETAQQFEKDLAASVIKRFQAEFPKEILEFKRGPDVDAEVDASELPVEVPTLFLFYTSTLSGGYTSPNPRGIYMGAGIAFRAAFVMPAGGKPIELTYRAWRRPELDLLKEPGKGAKDVYEDILGGAFESFEEKLLKTWFKKP